MLEDTEVSLCLQEVEAPCKCPEESGEEADEVLDLGHCPVTGSGSRPFIEIPP